MAEIMAPAGSQEQLTAAIRSGADCIYFGCGHLSARRYAQGFDDPAAVIDFCHARGVKAVAALNIVLTDHELPEAVRLIGEVAKAGGDGLIVQDLAVAALAKAICPALPLHASTQMTIHNVEGAKALEAMGFRRAVLARELTMSEIESISKETSLELEVFVHGALCMSVSGCCYLSSTLGGRSGNRGVCAQPCRLNFVREDQKPYALSLKDMSCLKWLPKLAKLGIHAFKIEGRMKRPEYVAAVITQVSAALAGQKPDMSLLADVFSRGGFTDGYIAGRRNEMMFGHRTKEDTVNTKKALAGLTQLYRHERQRIPLAMKLSVKAHQPVSLTLYADNNQVTIVGEEPVPAKERPLTKEFARDCLFRCGGSPYLPQEFTAAIEPGLMFPMAALKMLRRKGLEQLTAARLAASRRLINHVKLPTEKRYTPANSLSVQVAAQSFEQVKDFPMPERLYIPWHEILSQPEETHRWRPVLFADLPALHFNSQTFKDLLLQLKAAGITGVRVQNIGDIPPAVEMGFTVSGGAGLNITNTMALQEYKRLGLQDTLLSFELPKAPLRELGGTIKRGMLLYGHLPLMHMRACPLKRGTRCGDCKGEGVLTDRKGMSFRVVCSQRNFTTLYNPIPLYLGDKGTLPVDFGVVQFTNELPDICLKRYQMVLQQAKPDFDRTCGLYERTLL